MLYSLHLILLILYILLGLSYLKVEDTLGEHASLFKEHYYIKPAGNCDLSRMSDPHNEFKGKNVLIELNDSSALASKLGLPMEKYLSILGECRQKLFDVRSRRPRPHLDDKVFSLSHHFSPSPFPPELDPTSLKRKDGALSVKTVN